MGWRSKRSPWEFPFPGLSPTTPLSVNQQCFIRKDHSCGKLFGASKSCFIACPTQDDIETVLELISEKLSKAGVEPVIAVKERSYGQDIFCIKYAVESLKVSFAW
ncbi:MAG: hypothetical protein M1305_01950 [Candidatus Marsarchaeota archaeon]|nr:hypothetical protein [Candidatus Marsarchaeota archaeon]